MRRYLIVAHKTLGGSHLRDAVAERLEAGPCSFFLVVPATPPLGHAYSQGEVHQAAREKLDTALARFREMGAEVSGAVGDQGPVGAVVSLLSRGESFDEVVLSTLPPHLSRWVRMDVASRLRRETQLPVVHLTAKREPAALTSAGR